MDLLPARIPKVALDDFTALFVPPEAPFGSVVELVVKIEDESLNVREFAAYLSLVDRVYGRLTHPGLRSYSQTLRDQVEITEIRKG